MNHDLRDDGKMTYAQKIEAAKCVGITLPEDLLSENNIVGIYEFFRVKGHEEQCFYVGKSTDIAYRLLGASRGHIHMYLKNDLSKIVPRKIKEYREQGYEIQVKIIKVNYDDISFSRAAHRLALCELQEIVKYQEKGQCLFQLPEGIGKNEEKFWEKNYHVKDI